MLCCEEEAAAAMRAIMRGGVGHADMQRKDFPPATNDAMPRGIEGAANLRESLDTCRRRSKILDGG